MRLVADIGGTNARLALCENGAIRSETVRSYSNDDWPHFYDMLATYLKDLPPVQLADMVIAMAGPVHGKSAELTNRNWLIEKTELAKIGRCDAVTLLNDLTALGYAVPVLGPTQLECLHRGGAQKPEIKQSLVVGIGTGFNASPVIKTKDSVRCLTIEAGHVSMPLRISTMMEQMNLRVSDFPTVETLFSGRGFTAFCQLISHDDTLNGIDAIASYGNPNAVKATKAIDQYSDLLGELLRELCLAYMPNSGIYLAGSVARAICATAPHRCAAIFTMHCDIRAPQSPDLFTIQDDRAALNGCVAFG